MVRDTIHLFVLTVAIISHCGCGKSTPESSAPPQKTKPETLLVEPETASPVQESAGSSIHFTDVTQDSGIDFTYYGVPSPQAYMTEQNGGGVAIFDADGDRIPDIFLANGSHFEQPAQSRAHSDQFYLGNADCSFTSTTQKAFLLDYSYGMGVAAGDFDNDGFMDLFVACFGQNRLLQNQGDGTFRQIVSSAIEAGNEWSCSPTFADFDGDGLLDLYVVNYVDWISSDPPCNDPKHPEVRRTCSPTSKNAVADQLLRNNGDLTFDTVGAVAGITNDEIGKGLALGVFDVNNDGALDIYVANDTTANSLFLNQGKLKFKDAATEYGVAVSVDGVYGASMGVGIADFDLDGNEDILVTNFRNQVNDLYNSLGEPGFAYANTETGLDLSSRSKLAFGAIFRDFNGDTWPDIFISNGHIWDLTPLGKQYEYQMTASLLANQSGERFLDVSKHSGNYFEKKWLGRSVATGDLDNDGDLDLAIQHLEAPAGILRNDSVETPNSIIVDFAGVTSCRTPLGCRVRYSHNEKLIVSHIASGESFQASHDRRITIPIGSNRKLNLLEITWPDGRIEQWQDTIVAPGRQYVAIEGGQIVSLPSH